MYNDFYEKFIIKLSKCVSIRNIYCIPGNHDFNRKIVEDHFDNHKEILNEDFDETKFNEFIKTKDNLIQQKFIPYKKFCQEKLNLPHFNLYGYSELFIPEISIYFLNSALFASGGYQDINDEGILKIETSELNKWIQENDGRKKILVMHHPIEHLTSFAQKELKAMFNNGIDILINGHIHDQDIITNTQGHLKLCSPAIVFR